MKRKRDLQGKFTRKNQDYRRVRSLRLTDRTWKALGIAAEFLDITRADWIENLVQQNRGDLNIFHKNQQLSPEIKILDREKLSSLSEKVLEELRLGKQSSHYRIVQKALKRLIELASVPAK